MSPEEATEYALGETATPQSKTPAGRASPATEVLQAEGGSRGLKNNLPLTRNVFVGREREISDVGRALSSARLLTLTGAGGCGKSRMALEIARGLADVGADSYHDGVWLVELASLTEGDLVPGAMASVLGLREQADVPGLTVVDDARIVLSQPSTHQLGVVG